MNEELTTKEKEHIYDEKIAPELLRLGKLCQDNGLSFIAVVEWAPDEVGRTAFLSKGAGEGMRRANQILQGNFGVGMIAMTVTSKETRP